MLKSRALWVGTICLVVIAGLWSTAPRSLSFITHLSYLVDSYAVVLAVAERKKWGFSMGHSTMGIYLLHAPYVVWAVALGLTRVRPSDEVSTMLLLTALTVLFSWLLTRFMAKISIGRFMLGEDIKQLRRAAIS